MRMPAVGLGLLLLAALPSGAAAQVRDSARATPDTLPDARLLPREVATEVTDVFNASETLRASGPLDIAAGREVTGDVAVLNGPLTVAGRITGRVVAINADVVLQPGAQIEGEVLVVGGAVLGKENATVGGDIRVYRQLLDYRRDGERLVAQGENEEDERWWRRRQRWRSRSYSDIRLASARTYNRVEGLPIYIGPSLAQNFDGGRITIDAFGIFRTADGLEWKSPNIGHSLKTEVRLGRRRGLAIGGRLFDVVEGSEDWQLTDTEVGLASFFLHRDYRDYYDRHGGSGYVSLFFGRDADLTASLADERWGARGIRDPFTLFRNGQGWRVNPMFDEGRLHIANTTLRIDTRNDVSNPWSGWYIVADVERGSGEITAYGPTSAGVRDATPGRISYTRGLLDLRRYNRLGPDAQLNLRLVAGGWLSGDELPLQRRFSVGGPGTIPGFDFRHLEAGTDVSQCSMGAVPPGAPAQCERMMLAQVEYRADLFFDPLGLFDGSDWQYDRWGRGGAEWVLFADAGRGWLVGPKVGELQYEKGSYPRLGTFRTDIGAGIAFGPVGFYLAKALSDSKEPVNFFVRVKQRF